MIHMIGNAHIDPVWFWHWQEGVQEVLATFRSALDRIGETPNFIFTAACACYYKWVEEIDPNMFREIQERVRQGRWKIVGGMWIQPDCNMPSGESFARQLLLSQRYFRQKFGITVKTGYNVDSFGHAATLPMLFRHAGIDHYVMQRPEMRENGEIPFPAFVWESPDGSQVTTFRIDSYATGFGDVAQRIEHGLDMQKSAGYSVMAFYGVGNHGGGPTIRNLRSIEAYQASGKDGDQVIFSDPDAYFDALAAEGASLPVWKKELQHHASGCYSATSLIKALNRKTESALTRSEKFGALSSALTGHRAGSLRQGWENLLFNQFHDILCGCSIGEAYEDARVQLGEAQSMAAREENFALQKISWQIDTLQGVPGRKRSKESHFALWELDGLGTPLIVFNPHPYEVASSVQVYGGVKHITDENGAETPVQIVRASRTNGADKWDSLFTAMVPALGYRLYWVYLGEIGQTTHGDDRPLLTPADNPVSETSPLKASACRLENDKIALTIDEKTGMPRSLIHKASGKETLTAPARAQLFDVSHCDTWAHMVFKFDKAGECFGESRCTVVENGPVRATLRVTTRCGESTLTQDYSLTAEGDQIEVRARLDMQKPLHMLKFCYPVAAENPVARAEVAYGYVERPCDGCEETAHRWMHLGNEAIGLGIVNDGKYSFSAPENELRFTVANTSVYADHYGQQHRDEDCRHADMGLQEFRYALVPCAASWQEAGLPRRGEVLNQGLVSTAETYHRGKLPAHYEGLRIEAENVSLGALKRSEEDDGWVLRLSETMGRPACARIHAPMLGRDFQVELAPRSLKTLLLPDDATLPPREVLLTEWEG